LKEILISPQISKKNSQISNSTKIRPMTAKRFHADRRMDRHDKAGSRFSQFCKRA